MQSIQALRERRAARAQEARKILDENTIENGKWNAAMSEQYDQKVAEITAIDDSIKALMRQDEIEEQQALQAAKAGPRKGDLDPQSPEAKSRALLVKWMRGGDKALTDADWADIRATMSVGTGSQGGYTVPSLISQQLIDAMKAYGAMRATSTVLPTSDGKPLSFPGSDGTAEVGELIGENTTATAADPSFSTVPLNVFKYSSKVVAIPFELLQDSIIDVEAFVRVRLAQRLGRIGNQHFSTGTGSGQPYGAATQAGQGKTGTTGQTLTVIYDDLVDVIHSLDPAYRNARCVWQMNDTLVKVVRKLKDGQNRPLWMPSWDLGITVGPNRSGEAGYPTQSSPVPFDSLLGYPLFINNDLAAPAANAKSALFGDFSQYYVRDAMGVELFRFTDSAYTKLGQVGFLAWCRMGGNLLDTKAIAYYQHSAT